METLYLTETGGGGRCFFNSLYFLNNFKLGRDSTTIFRIAG